MTTSTLQQLVYLQGRRDIGRRAVVVGAEHVSFSAVATLAHGGASTAALVTDLPRQQSLMAFRAGARVRHRVPVWANSRVIGIHGDEGRVTGAAVAHLDAGWAELVECDLVIFTADWIPDHELAVMAGCELDRGTLGPRVDGSMRTPVPGLFATGNVIHPAETADSCALSGRHAAASIARHLESGAEWPANPVNVMARDPLRWVVPGLIAAGDPGVPRGRFLLRSREFRRAPKLRVTQGETELWRGRLRRLVPGRSAHIPGDWAERVDPEGPQVSVAVE
jgi:Pyridine nucleotide-disulphide oxidoreductase